MDSKRSAYETVNKLDVTGALAVAVAGTVLGSGGVAVVLGHATIGIHGDKVQGSVQAAADVRDVNIKGELVVEQSEHLVGVFVLHEVGAATNVGAVLMLGDELEAQLVAAGLDSVRLPVVGTVDAANLGASSAIRADGRVPFIAGVAVGARFIVRPSPVGVNDDAARGLGAAT
jgi:hypothetical protein